MSSGLTPTQEAFLASQRLSGLLREAVEDLSAADFNRMSMADYAKIREQAGLTSMDPFAQTYSFEPPGQPRQDHPGQDPQAATEAQHPLHSVEHPDIDFSQLSMSDYKRVREHLGIGRSPSARGIFGN